VIKDRVFRGHLPPTTQAYSTRIETCEANICLFEWNLLELIDLDMRFYVAGASCIFLDSYQRRKGYSSSSEE
jgi:hypothetical protein